jgi:LPS-assembly protein
MNLPSRRKPLALILCYGVASVLVGGYSAGAQAQAPVPLRVDPALLGLPPIEPADLPAPAAKKPVVSSPEPTEASTSAEVAPVEVPTVEERPTDVETPVEAGPSESGAGETAAAVEPQTQAASSPQVAPAPAVAPAAAVSGKSQAVAEPAAQIPTQDVPAVDQPAAKASVGQIKPSEKTVARAVPYVPAPASSRTALAPLRVDPALLGLPPVSGSSVASSPDRPPSGSARAFQPPVADASSPRGEGATPEGDESGLHASSEADAVSGTGGEPPVFLSAHRMGGVVDREFVAEGAAELRKVDTVVTADRLTYWPLDDEMEAEGNVTLKQLDDRITGPKMRMKLEEQVGYFEQPAYFLKRQPSNDGTVAADANTTVARIAEQPVGDYWNSGFESPLARDNVESVRKATEGRGEADRIDFEGENQIRLTNGTYTTCAPGNDDWYAKASEIRLDYDREVGEGKNGTVYFKDVPILYSPWLSFSLNNERKSGFLSPTFGTSSDNGVELSLPYYWNIAPNMDATFTPRVLTKRGVQLSTEFRYLNKAFGGQYQGEMLVETLPGDALRDGDNRYGISLLHTQSSDSGLSGQINYNKVSDDDYYTDLSSSIASTSETQLLQQAQMTYSAGWWSATANFQQYQTLQPDADNPVREPYKLLPQVTVNARQPDLYGTDSTFLGQYTHFTRSDQEINGVVLDGDGGQRTVLYPQVALPYVTPGWYVTPKLGVNATRYSLTGQAADIPGTINRTLPIFSVDSGMTFERSSNWFGRDYTQTLEPRLYYLNIPYENQDDIPLFDTALADFNFAQIFSENQFSSWDRISNANQLTAAITSKLLEPGSGNEIVRAMFGQRFYFTKNKVSLSASTSSDSEDDKWEKSDFLAAFSGQILPKVYGDLALQYNPSDRDVKRYSMGASYRPEPGKVLNASYRYNQDSTAPINQVDLSGQWPLSGRWHAVGRVNYSFKDDGVVLSSGSQGGRIIESIAGLEYNGGCWVVRGVVRRTALTSEDASTAFYIQLELNDFSRIGSNPINLLKRNIQGYSLINQTSADPAFDE